MLVELAAGLRVARGLEIAFGFASAMQNTISRRALLLALPFRSLARLTKFDDVTHPELGHQACEAYSLVRIFWTRNAPAAWQPPPIPQRSLPYE
jgi:hypothetical protein